MRRALVLALLLIAAKPLPVATLYIDNLTPSFGDTINLSYEVSRIGRHDAVYPSVICYQDGGTSPVYAQDGQYTLSLGTDSAADYDVWDSDAAECDVYLYVYHYTAQGTFTGYTELAELELDVGA